MKDHDGFVFNSPKRPEEEKDDPKKMDQDYAICKNLINHLLMDPHLYNRQLIIGLNSFQEKGLKRETPSENSDWMRRHSIR
jgi:hypothetical protein